MEDEGVGNCGNCGASDFVLDYERGETTCLECGCVDRDAPVMVVCGRYKDAFDAFGNRLQSAPLSERSLVGSVVENVAVGKAVARQRKTQSAPYSRPTYFAERCSQWQGLEPPIDTGDFRVIEDRYHYYCGGKWRLPGEEVPHAKWQKSHCLSKEDTRFLLWEIDSERRSKGLKSYFVKKYLVRCSLVSCSATCCWCCGTSGMQGGVCVHG